MIYSKDQPTYHMYDYQSDCSIRVYLSFILYNVLIMAVI